MKHQYNFNVDCKMSSFRAHEWVLVADTDICTHSREQIQVLQTLDQKVKGAILCNETQHENSAPCQQVPAFPAFCNLESQFCFSGLRTDQTLLDEIQSESDAKRVHS
tara:strand:- start:387 stop:707 length:321 start_codon:yes stop_codon:yes gene_type:complete